MKGIIWLKTCLFLLILSDVFNIRTYGQNKIHEVDVTVPVRQIEFVSLKLGGLNKKGEKIQVNSYYLSLNDSPILPVTGEFPLLPLSK